jgi:hypothetical protein
MRKPYQLAGQKTATSRTPDFIVRKEFHRPYSFGHGGSYNLLYLLHFTPVDIVVLSQYAVHFDALSYRECQPK